jgi:hypothetical protein
MKDKFSRSFGRFYEFRTSPWASATAALAGTFVRGQSPIGRLWCVLYFALLIGLPLTLIFAQKSDQVLGNVLAYGITIVVWALALQWPTVKKQRIVADGSTFDARMISTPFFVLTAVELILVLSTGWWNTHLPGVLRGVAWGIVAPLGWADLVCSLLTVLVTWCGGYPLYRRDMPETSSATQE